MPPVRLLDQCGAIFSERADNPTLMKNRGWTISGSPEVYRINRGMDMTSWNGVGDKAVWTGAIGTVKSVSFWCYARQLTVQEIMDFDGGTHYIDSFNAEIRAQGFATPTIYVNGVATDNHPLDELFHVCITTATGFDASAFKLATDGTNYGAVFLGEVSLWNRVLSAAEALMLAKDEIKSYEEHEISRWDMSETNPKDVGWRNSGNHGTGTGLVAATDIVAGPYNGMRAIEFNGTDEWGTVAAGTAMNASTISMLVKWNSIGVNQYLMDDRGSSGGTDYIWFAAASPTTFTVLGGRTVYTDGVAGAVAALNQWKHIVVTGCVIKGTALRIGSRSNNSEPFNGAIADLRIYNSALTPIQAADLNARLRGGA